MHTEINERGPSVSAHELELFREKLLYLAQGASICVFAGSLPRGVGPDVYADLIREVRKLGVTTIIDTDGEPLRLAVRAEPDVVSPNELEAEELVGHEFNDDDDRAQAVVEMTRLGAARGDHDGARRLLRAGARGRRCRRSTGCAIEEQEARSPIGSGDAFLAGYVAARYAGRSAVECLRFGVACGAESTQHFGAGHRRAGEGRAAARRGRGRAARRFPPRSPERGSGRRHPARDRGRRAAATIEPHDGCRRRRTCSRPSTARPAVRAALYDPVMEVEIGRGKKARRAYGFDDIAIVPSRRTRDPDDVDISWTLGPYRFELPLLAAALDGVVSPRRPASIGKLGGLAVLNLEGIFCRYEDADEQLERIATFSKDIATREMQDIYSRAGQAGADRAADRGDQGARRRRRRVADAAEGPQVLRGRARGRARHPRDPGHGRLGRARLERRDAGRR